MTNEDGRPYMVTIDGGAHMELPKHERHHVDEVDATNEARRLLRRLEATLNNGKVYVARIHGPGMHRGGRKVTL